jgi:hypothetical protein
LNNTIIYFHVATIGKYQDIFDEIIIELKRSNLFYLCSKMVIGVVGEGILNIPYNHRIEIYKSANIEFGEFFTLNLLKNESDSLNINHKILYLHTKGVTAGNNLAIRDWRVYMTYFLVNRYIYCVNSLTIYDACGVDYEKLPAPHFSGNFWWSNSEYIKTLPKIEEISNPLSHKILTLRHNAEFWIGMGKGSLHSLNNSGINIFERHNNRYPIIKYKY